jgi:phosphohistidine phosphatase
MIRQGPLAAAPLFRRVPPPCCSPSVPGESLRTHVRAWQRFVVARNGYHGRPGLTAQCPAWQAPAVDTRQPRKLVLLRHAKSAWPEGVPDIDRPLGDRGRRDAPAVGRWLRLASYEPDLVLCSPARRARQTWQFAQAELGIQPDTSFEPAVYEATADSLLDLVRRIPSTARTVVIVGHDPGLPELAQALAGDTGQRGQHEADQTPGIILDRMRAKFPTAAVAVLEVTGPWSELAPDCARLAEFITPREMTDIGRRS